jgi:hypothetical protein
MVIEQPHVQPSVLRYSITAPRCSSSRADSSANGYSTLCEGKGGADGEGGQAATAGWLARRSDDETAMHVSRRAGRHR